MKNPGILWYALAILIGLIPAFIVVFNAIFSDVFTVPDRLSTFAVTVAAYALLGIVFGSALAAVSWKWGIWLSLPAFPLVLCFSVTEPGRWLLHLAYLALALGSASLSAYAASRLRLRRTLPG